MKVKWNVAVNVIAVLLILFVIIWTFIPRVTNSVQDDFSPITAQEYPALYQAYQQLRADNSLSQITPEDALRIVTVKNLWSNCEYYILPCYIIDLDTVPHAGSTGWSAALHILVACSNENSFAAKLCSLDVREFSLEMKPGENTFVYSYADIMPSDIRVDDPKMVPLDGPVDCLVDPQIRVTYTVATGESAEQREVGTLVYFDWYYSIYCCGKPLVGYHQSVYQDYIVNA